MAVPPLRLGDRFESYISGDVIIHDSAVLAPGVIIRADVNSKIMIGAGVCIGMGTILQVETGILEVRAGANLGAGVLIVGAGIIGENACIGAATTLYNGSVAPAQIVPPGSILGNIGRNYSLNPSSDTSADGVDGIEKKHQLPDVWDDTKVETSGEIHRNHAQGLASPQENLVKSTSELGNNKSSPEEIEATEETQGTEGTKPSSESTESTDTQTASERSQNSSLPTTNPNLSPHATTGYSETFGTQIYGQTSVQRLLTTLFPHRQPLNQPVSDDKSE